MWNGRVKEDRLRAKLRVLHRTTWLFNVDLSGSYFFLLFLLMMNSWFQVKRETSMEESRDVSPQPIGRLYCSKWCRAEQGGPSTCLPASGRIAGSSFGSGIDIKSLDRNKLRRYPMKLGQGLVMRRDLRILSTTRDSIISSPKCYLVNLAERFTAEHELLFSFQS